MADRDRRTDDGSMDRMMEEGMHSSSGGARQNSGGSSSEEMLPQHDARLSRPIPGMRGRSTSKRSDEGMR